MLYIKNKGKYFISKSKIIPIMKGNRNTQTKQSHILLTQLLDDDIVKALNEYNEVAEEKVSKARFIRDLIRVGLKNQHQIPATV